MLFQEKVRAFGDLPVKNEYRKYTDFFCVLFSGSLALILFIIALAFMNKQNYYECNFPTDSDHRPCAYAQNQKYPYIFFPDINVIDKRVCVSVCPDAPSKELQCRTNSQITSCLGQNTYPSSQQLDRLGGFCAPNSDAARNKLIENLNLTKKWNFLNTYDIIQLSLAIVFVTGLVWMILVQLIPRVMAPAAILLGSFILIASGVIIILQAVGSAQVFGAWSIPVGAICIILGVIFFITLFLYKRRIAVTGIFLAYSSRFISQKPINFVFIPIFIIFLAGLIVLCLFEAFAFSSHQVPIVVPGDIYLQLNKSSVFTILTILEFIWGIQFLKDSFNFLVSGNAAEWYIKGDKASSSYSPVDRLLRYNWGSVVGGSFLNAYFNFLDFLFELLRCYPEGSCGACAPMCTTFSKCCGCFFDLIRNDAYTYINLTGIPYCNAARNCEVLCNSSKLFVGSQSVMFFYRLCAHIFCIGVTSIVCYYLMKARNGVVSFDSLLIIMVLTYCLVTYLIDIHADAAEALQISYLIQFQLSGGNHDQLTMDIQGLKGELRGMEQKLHEGSC